MCLKQQNSGLLCFGATARYSSIYCNWTSLPPLPPSFRCLPHQLLLWRGIAWLLLAFLRSVSLCHLSRTFLPLIWLLCREPLWWTISYFLMTLVLILKISNYSSRLPAHLCVHLYTYLSLPPKGRYIHWLCFLLNYRTLKLAGMKVHQWNENLEKWQFTADTEPSLPACLASFSCQLRTESVLCVREVLRWIKRVAQGSHDSTLEIEVRCEIFYCVERHSASPWLFLYLSLFPSVNLTCFLTYFCLFYVLNQAWVNKTRTNLFEQTTARLNKARTELVLETHRVAHWGHNVTHRLFHGMVLRDSLMPCLCLRLFLVHWFSLPDQQLLAISIAVPVVNCFTQVSL